MFKKANFQNETNFCRTQDNRHKTQDKMKKQSQFTKIEHKLINYNVLRLFVVESKILGIFPDGIFQNVIGFC
jgi:hypothetical protein